MTESRYIWQIDRLPDESDGDIVDRHHLGRLVLYHVIQQLVQFLGDAVTSDIIQSKVKQKHSWQKDKSFLYES